MNAVETTRIISRETAAAQDLVRALGNEDDPDLVADSIEGETGLHEAIEAGLDEIDDLEVMCIGLKTKEMQFASRRAAFEARIERIRAAIERAMVSVDLPTLKLASATLSVARRAPQVVIENEAEVPARFFTQPPAPPPAVDKKAIAAALNADEAVPGARLDNGSVALTVRRK